MKPSDDFAKLLTVYEDALLDDVIPWWMEHGIDWEMGGVTEAIAEDGQVYSYDKPIWSLGRALFVWSKLYNDIGKRDEWLDVANRMCEFLLPIGRKSGWVWPGKVHRDGSVMDPSRAIYADGFAMMGLTEYAQATGDEDAMAGAVATYETVRERMRTPGVHLAVPEAVADVAKTHGISMISASVFHELGILLDDAEILKAGHDHAAMILDEYLKPEERILHEYLALDGSLLQRPPGQEIIAGHAIESMWFLMNIFEDRHEKWRIAQCVEAVKWHLEACWDEECGGMFLFLDAEDGKLKQREGQSKIMWPHTEALVALLLGYELTGEKWCLEWYDRVHEWTWAHFPVAEYGEWHRGVARDGSFPWGVTGEGKMPRKEPFHLPRALITCVTILQRLAGR